MWWMRLGWAPAQVPVGRDYRVSAAAVKRAMTRNTALVVASSPCFPHGVIDDVAGIAQVPYSACVLVGSQRCPRSRMQGQACRCCGCGAMPSGRPQHI